MFRICLTILVTVAVFSLPNRIAIAESQARDPKQQQTEKKADPFDAIRAKTDQEKVKAKFFDGIGANRLLQTNVVPVLIEETTILHNSNPTYATFVRDRVCESDAVLVGTPTDLRVQFTLDETFLFTDYTVRVETWIRPALETAREITVSRAGGQVTIAGRTLKAKISDPLYLKRSYVFFLQRIKGTTAFARTLMSEVEFEKGYARPISQRILLPPEVAKAKVNRSDFVIDLLNARSTCGGTTK